MAAARMRATEYYWNETKTGEKEGYFSTDDEQVEFDVGRIIQGWEGGEAGSLIGRGQGGTVDDMDQQQDLPFFTKLYTLTQILGVLSVVLVGVWVGLFRGGFGWASDPALRFNWHPFLMVMGLVFLYANGALIYRGFRSERKKKLKVMHALIHLGALLLAVVGLVAVFSFHKAKGIADMYSLHSWLGIVAVFLFCCQWLAGLVTFLFPGLRSSLRAAYLPLHHHAGLLIFLLVLATALIGLTEKAIFLMNAKQLEKGGPELVLINVTGLVLAVFGALVVLLVSKQKFRRQATEDEILLTSSAMD